MPKKKKIVEPTTNTTEEPFQFIDNPINTEKLVGVVETSVAATVPLEPVVEVPKEPETVKIRVKTGSLSFEMGTFEHGSIITVPKERVARFDPNSIEVVA